MTWAHLSPRNLSNLSRVQILGTNKVGEWTPETEGVRTGVLLNIKTTLAVTGSMFAGNVEETTRESTVCNTSRMGQQQPPFSFALFLHSGGAAKFWYRPLHTVNPDVIACMAWNHPDRELLEYLVQEFYSGFDLGLTREQPCSPLPTLCAKTWL